MMMMITCLQVALLCRFYDTGDTGIQSYDHWRCVTATR